MLLRHAARLADSRARTSAGSSSEIRIAMMPMTTRSSTRVKALFRRTRHHWKLNLGSGCAQPSRSSISHMHAIVPLPWAPAGKFCGISLSYGITAVGQPDPCGGVHVAGSLLLQSEFVKRVRSIHLADPSE